jgi:hypothetical protein
VYPTYAPVSASPNSTNLTKNHVQLPLLSRSRVMLLAVFLPVLGLTPEFAPGFFLYRLCDLTVMMSWLSDSSPVSAEKPRYATGGTLKLGMSKQVVHSSTDLYWSSSLRYSSWK